MMSVGFHAMNLRNRESFVICPILLSREHINSRAKINALWYIFCATEIELAC